MRHVRLGAVPTVFLAAAALLITTASPAAAAQTTGWAAWGALTGSSNNYATTMQLPGLGFPRTVVASDSRSQAQLAGGISTFLGGPADRVPTPIGDKYGSSKGKQYLNLRPLADTESAPSTTTYTFDTPTPAAGWAFALGDVDSDQVQVTARDAAGEPVSNAVIDAWFRGVFNYAGDTDLPHWAAASSTLIGNASAADTNGASGWFEPNVGLSSLTFVFTRRAGFPIYQTWFASLAHTISGTVGDVSTGTPGCSLTQSTVRLTAPTGDELASTHPTAGGAYSFGQATSQAGYTVALEPPPGCAVVGSDQRTVGTTTGDATADFQVRRTLPNPISGTVTSGGAGVPGVQVTLTSPGGTTRTTDTDSEGHYLFDDNVDASGYTVTVGVPLGYTVSGPSTLTVDLKGGPVTGQDFTLAEQARVSGTVTGGGEPLGAVTVTLTPASGPAITTSTRGDGGYDFAHVPAGVYDVSVTPPSGYDTALARELTVGTADVPGVNFDLDRPGALGGTVGGATAGGVAITVSGPGATHELTTDGAGDYFLEGLSAGQYTITPQAPGYRSSPAERTVTITAAGEVRGGQDFTLTAAPASTAPTPTAPSSTAPSSTAPSSITPATGSTNTETGSAASLADTGAPTRGGLWLGVGLFGLGMLFVVLGRRRRDRARHAG